MTVKISKGDKKKKRKLQKNLTRKCYSYGHSFKWNTANTDKVSTVEVYNSEGLTALHSACLAGDEMLVRFLISQCSADVGLLTVDGWSVLHLAAFSGNCSLVKYISRILVERTK